MEQYDAIAGDYQEIAAAVPLREPEWYSLRLRLGDLAGLSVLDLACGDGMGSRLLKRWGAARVAVPLCRPDAPQITEATTVSLRTSRGAP